MSTILKALRRLEEEKTTVSDGRPLREEVASRAPAPPPPGRLRRWAPAAGALVLGLLAGGAVFWAATALLAPAEPEPPVASAAPDVGGRSSPAAAERAAPAPPSSPSASPARTADTEGPPDHAFASDVEVVPRRRATPRIADAEPVQPRRAEKPGSRRPVESSSAAARQRQIEEMRRTLEAAREPAMAPEDRILPAPTPSGDAGSASATAASEPPRVAEPAREDGSDAAPRDAAVARAVPSEPSAAEPAPRPAAPPPPPERTAEREVASAPAVEPEPAPTQPSVAEPAPAPDPGVALAVQRTEWHPLADRRRAWVVVDSAAPRTVVEGDVVEGLIVSEIEPSGVVFERDGESLRREVGKP